MAAPQPTGPQVQPAPTMPALAKSEPALVTYLRSLVLWITQEFQTRPSITQAQPFFLLQQSDATPGTTPKVYKVTVDGTGALHTAVMTLGVSP